MSATDSAVNREEQPEETKKSPREGGEEELAHNPEVEEFFKKLKSDLHRPKPSPEAIATALQAIQHLAFEAGQDPGTPAMESNGAPGRLACPFCGSPNREGHRFCGTCGAPLSEPVPEQAEAPAAHSQSKGAVHPNGQHHYHHHYHHHYFHAGLDGATQAVASGQRPPAPTVSGPDAGRARTAGGPSLSKAEAALRKMTQDWALACNTKQLDDLVDFYAADALVLRSNLPPVRGTAAIREFFFAALDAGLGEVEMEPLRVELMGEVAYEAGRCKMLVPLAVGKRREERGKYLVIFIRQSSGEWKAVADCWASDLSLKVSTEPETAKTGTLLSSAKTPRKSA